MKSTLRFLATIAAAVSLAYAIDVQAEGPNLVGKAPPEIKAGGFLNAETAPTLAALKGKVTVVEFWATWCGPCRQSVPHLVELYKAKGKDGLVLIGLSAEEKEPVEAFAKKMSMNYIVGYKSESASDYGVSGIPHAFVIGKDGNVAWAGHPMSKDFEGAIDKAMEAK